MLAGGNGLGLPMRLSSELGRSPIGYPDLHGSQTLGSETLAVGLDSLGR